MAENKKKKKLEPDEKQGLIFEHIDFLDLSEVRPETLPEFEESSPRV
jgi:hypothetical protein